MTGKATITRLAPKPRIFWPIGWPLIQLGKGSENTLIIGDLNAYAMEDPITALEDAGFTDLADEFIDGASSFVFDGQAGTLGLRLGERGAYWPKSLGVTEWRINSDEATVIDYNLDFGRDPSLYNGDTACAKFRP